MTTTPSTPETRALHREKMRLRRADRAVAHTYDKTWCRQVRGAPLASNKRTGKEFRHDVRVLRRSFPRLAFLAYHTKNYVGCITRPQRLRRAAV